MEIQTFTRFYTQTPMQKQIYLLPLFACRVINTEFKDTKHIIAFYIGPVSLCLFFCCLVTAKAELNLLPPHPILT